MERRKRTPGPLFVKDGNIDMPFLVLVLALLSIGLIMLFSASHARAFYEYGNSYIYIFQQLILAVIGVVVMFAVSFFNYRKLHHLALLGYVGSVGMLVLTHFMPAQQGAQRWIIIAGHQFQPSEVAKACLVVFLAHIICKYQDRMGEFKVGIILMGTIFAIMALPLVTQPHLSATILLLCMTAAMMFVGGVKMQHIAAIIIGLVIVGALVYLFMPGMEKLFAHAERRLTNWLDPFQDAQGAGYQSVQSLYAIGSGGILGVGIGESRQKFMYLPEVQNDFVFAIVCEETGFIGATFVILLFALLVWRGFAIAMKARDKFGALIVVGLTTQVGIQAILNIAVVTNTVPNTGISLPFFSYGGTALLVMLAQMGLILGVSRQINYEKE